MVFAIDAGNTNIVLGVFDAEGKILFTSRIATDRAKTGEQYAVEISGILGLYGIERSGISGSVISTVVPELVGSLSAAVRILFGHEAVIVGKGSVCGLEVRGLKPSDIGADLICGAVGAIKKYGAPAIIFDFGTATTVTAVDSGGVFIGGSIIPGVMISLRALSSSAALLQDIAADGAELKPISLDTAESMRSGLIIGNACMMDGMIERFREELGKDTKVIATGGLAGVIVPHCRTEGIILDGELLLNGLYEIYKDNRRSGGKFDDKC